MSPPSLESEVNADQTLSRDSNDCIEVVFSILIDVKFRRFFFLLFLVAERLSALPRAIRMVRLGSLSWNCDNLLVSLL